MRAAWVVPAGLVAGLVINFSGIAVVHFLLGPDYVSSLLALVPDPKSPWILVHHLSIRFGFGILCVLLFAALRPAFFHRWTTVLAAGGFVFLAGYVPLAAMLNEFGVLSGWKMWATLLSGWAEAVGATFLGAWLFERLAGR